MSDPFEDALGDVGERTKALARSTKALIVSVLPGVVEVAWPRLRVIGYGVGPRKMSEHFCYIGTAKRHVTLGFYYGAQLPDPAKLLEGTGKLLRHIKIVTGDQLADPAVRRLLEAASRHLPRLGGRAEGQSSRAGRQGEARGRGQSRRTSRRP
jgi:hypothetical protein